MPRCRQRAMPRRRGSAHRRSPQRRVCGQSFRGVVWRRARGDLDLPSWRTRSHGCRRCFGPRAGRYPAAGGRDQQPQLARQLRRRPTTSCACRARTPSCSGSTARPSDSPPARPPSSGWRRRWPRCWTIRPASSRASSRAEPLTPERSARAGAARRGGVGAALVPRVRARAAGEFHVYELVRGYAECGPRAGWRAAGWLSGRARSAPTRSSTAVRRHPEHARRPTHNDLLAANFLRTARRRRDRRLGVRRAWATRSSTSAASLRTTSLGETEERASAGGLLRRARHAPAHRPPCSCSGSWPISARPCGAYCRVRPQPWTSISLATHALISTVWPYTVTMFGFASGWTAQIRASPARRTAESALPWTSNTVFPREAGPSALSCPLN